MIDCSDLLTAPLNCVTPEYNDDYLGRCHDALDFALAKIPAYRGWKYFDSGDRSSINRFRMLPTIDKQKMRHHTHAGFCDPDLNIEDAIQQGTIEIVHTSGTSGDKVSNIWHGVWWDACEVASWKLNSVAQTVATCTHPEASLASALCVGFPCEDGYLTRSQRTFERFLFLNERSDPTTWTHDHMNRMVQELNDFKPVILEANPSFLARLARHVVRHKMAVHRPVLISLTFENPSRLHYRQIHAAIRAPIASSYGSTEAGYVFTECECGRLHQNTDCVHVDFLPFKTEHGGPRTGTLLVTTLNNPWRSLIRFDIGDIGLLSSSPCPCGRRLGITLDSIEGRAINLTLDTAGRAITQARVDREIATIEDIDEYQLFQLGKGRYLFKIAATIPGRALTKNVIGTLQGIFGSDADIRIEFVPFITPDPPGKYRLTRSCLNIDPMEFVENKFRPVNEVSTAL